jgi:imidazolonepropionase-like amidohydrolase
MLEGQVGIIAPNAYADLLVVDGDPFKDLGVLQNDGTAITAIMRSGRFVKNALNG